jgi:hypothetical protein
MRLFCLPFACVLLTKKKKVCSCKFINKVLDDGAKSLKKKDNTERIVRSRQVGRFDAITARNNA